ncbi:hypothetical protein Tco_0392446 [Tanacetum coccineum]
MLCYLAGMEPYYLKCVKDGQFQPKTVDGDAKPESQWTPNERRVVVQDQRLKSIIMSCLPDDIMESVISCVSAKETWTDLVHSFEGPSDTKENRIMDLKLEYQTFRANLPEKWLTFSQGLRNANHTQTLDLADIYGRFVYEDNLIQRRYSDTKKALITTPSSTAISTAFFSNNVIQDFQENSDDEVDERSSEEYLRDLDIEYHERALFSSPNSSSQADPKFQKDYKAEYKKMKAKLALLEASPLKVSDDEEVTQVKVLMALADDELTVGKSPARNGEWVDISIQKEQLKEEKKINEKWLTSLKKVSQCISEQIPHQKKKILGGELLTESLSKINVNENAFIPASMDYDHEMVPKSKDWVERLNPDSKLPNFNTRRILVPESQAINKSPEPTKTLNTP